MALREWYANRELLLTGATSDVGRALLEKILRAFPTVKVYALLRSKDGVSAEDRIRSIFVSPRFERLRQEVPDSSSRVKAVEADLLHEGLSVSTSDKALFQRVTVALHAAGPFEGLLSFCDELPRVQIVAMVSSVFQREDRVLNSSKQLNKPLALVRVPLVGPAVREPMPGFVDVLRGSTALVVGAGLALGNSDYRAEIIPIDLAVNTLLVAAWERAAASSAKGPTVYNAAPIGCTWAELIKNGQRGNRKFGYPTFGLRGMTSVAALHWILVLLFEYLPSALCDRILRLAGAKERFLGEQRRVRNALRSLESISSRPWPAETNSARLLRQRLTPEEQDAFPVAAEIDLESYVLCAAASARKHCVDENNIRAVKIFRLLFLFLAALVLLGALLFSRYHVPGIHRDA